MLGLVVVGFMRLVFWRICFGTEWSAPCCPDNRERTTKCGLHIARSSWAASPVLRPRCGRRIQTQTNPNTRSAAHRHRKRKARISPKAGQARSTQALVGRLPQARRASLLPGCRPRQKVLRKPPSLRIKTNKNWKDIASRLSRLETASIFRKLQLALRLLRFFGSFKISNSTVRAGFKLGRHFSSCRCRAAASWSQVSAICSSCFRWEGSATRAISRHSAAWRWYSSTFFKRCSSQKCTMSGEGVWFLCDQRKTCRLTCSRWRVRILDFQPDFQSIEGGGPDRNRTGVHILAIHKRHWRLSANLEALSENG